MADGHFPTQIDAFYDIVSEYMLLNVDGEASTRLEAIRHFRRFVRWCNVHGFDHITSIKRKEVESFIYSPTFAGGKAFRPGWSTIRNRRTYLRRVFRASRQIGYELFDPTVDVELVLERTTPSPICNDTDIDRLRTGAPLELFETSYAALLALAEAGSTNGEVRQVRVCDVNLDDGVVYLRGSARIDERVNPLTDWGMKVMRERISHLEGDDYVVVNSVGAQCSEAVISQMFRQISEYGHVGRSRLNINSVRGWRARCIYMECGQIQDAALFLGNRSLDATAELIGLEWREVQ
jgi:hypothetical protein